MLHTSKYTHRLLQIFNLGNTSNYYIDLPVFEVLVPDIISTASIALLQGAAKKAVFLDNPHVIKHAVRMLPDPTYTCNTITELKDSVDRWLFSNAKPLEICENAIELKNSKQKENIDIIYDIENQLIWKKEMYLWVSYSMNLDSYNPWKLIGKIDAICVNADTGKFFLTTDVAPWIIKWPVQITNSNIQNAPDFDPLQPWSILTIVSNIVNAGYSIDIYPNELYNTSISLRINNKNIVLTFSDISGFSTPESIICNIQNDTVLSIKYNVLFSTYIYSNIQDVKVLFDVSTLPQNIKYDEMLSIPCTLNLPSNTYTFKPQNIPGYWTPDIKVVPVIKSGISIFLEYEEKLQYGNIKLYTWKAGVTSTSRITYGNLTVNDWLLNDIGNEEVTYGIEKCNTFFN